MSVFAAEIRRVLRAGMLILAAGALLAARKPAQPAGPATDLSNAYAFPVPFKPASAAARIHFFNLSTTATIRIYTLNGELVRTLLEDDGDGVARWDATNDQGEPVASAAYVYVIENAEQTKSGKLLIVR